MRHFNWWKRRKIVSTGFAVILHLLTEPGSRTLSVSNSQCRRVLLYIHSHGAVFVSTHLHRAPRSLSPWGERTGSYRCHPLLLSLLRLTAPPSNSSVEGVHISPAFMIPRKQIEKKSMTMCYQALASSFPNCTTKMVLVHSHALTENPYTARTVLVGVLCIWPFLLHCIFSH